MKCPYSSQKCKCVPGSIRMEDCSEKARQIIAKRAKCGCNQCEARNLATIAKLIAAYGLDRR